jgi:hypothetical protein
MPRGKVFFTSYTIFQRPAALLRPPDSSFLSCLNSSSFKTSSLSLQNSGPQVVKYQISQGFKHVHNPHTRDSLFTSFVTARSLLQVIMLIFNLF